MISSSGYASLLAQAEKLRKHNRQGSYGTHRRYHAAFCRFLRYLWDEYRLQKIVNIRGKHLRSYVAYLKEKGAAPSTIKTELSALRFYLDIIPNNRQRLPGNEELLLARRTLWGIDHSWSPYEFTHMVAQTTDRICRAIR